MQGHTAISVVRARALDWIGALFAAAATLLFVDAWFDVLTASSRSERVIAIVEAAVVELPIAVTCLLLARSVERRLAAAELAAEDGA